MWPNSNLRKVKPTQRLGLIKCVGRTLSSIVDNFSTSSCSSSFTVAKTCIKPQRWRKIWKHESVRPTKFDSISTQLSSEQCFSEKCSDVYNNGDSVSLLQNRKYNGKSKVNHFDVNHEMHRIRPGAYFQKLSAVSDIRETTWDIPKYTISCNASPSQFKLKKASYKDNKKNSPKSHLMYSCHSVLSKRTFDSLQQIDHNIHVKPVRTSFQGHGPLKKCKKFTDKNRCEFAADNHLYTLQNKNPFKKNKVKTKVYKNAVNLEPCLPRPSLNRYNFKFSKNAKPKFSKYRSLQSAYKRDQEYCNYFSDAESNKPEFCASYPITSFEKYPKQFEDCSEAVGYYDDLHLLSDSNSEMPLKTVNSKRKECMNSCEKYYLVCKADHNKKHSSIRDFSQNEITFAKPSPGIAKVLKNLYPVNKRSSANLKYCSQCLKKKPQSGVQLLDKSVMVHPKKQCKFENCDEKPRFVLMKQSSQSTIYEQLNCVPVYILSRKSGPGSLSCKAVTALKKAGKTDTGTQRSLSHNLVINNQYKNNGSCVLSPIKKNKKFKNFIIIDQSKYKA